MVIQAAGAIWIGLIANPDLAYSRLVVAMVFAGIGLSLALPSAQASVLGAVSQEAVGKAAGTNTMMRELGGVFGIAVAVAVFAEAGSYVSPQAFVDGFGPALGVAAGLAAVAAIAGALLPGRRQARELIGGPTPIPAFETE